MLRQILLFVHLLGAIAWIGGMFFAYFCLRPAAAQVLAPPQRLPLWTATFSRFLPYMAVAVLIILVTGTSMLLSVGLQQAPAGWHAMMTLGVLMAVVFAYVYAALFPRLRERCAAADWAAAGQALTRIRQLVAVNWVLGVRVVVAAGS